MRERTCVQPIFYTSHAWFDRLWHFLYLSPELQDRFDYTWAPVGWPHSARLWPVTVAF
jgi:hypothetical protein